MCFTRARIAACACAIAVTGCASPSARYDAAAQELGFARVTLQGERFRHVAYASPPDTRGRTLHVYVEHDGTPWVDGVVPAVDPTPRQPLALRLMAQDPGPSLLLGRPCYFGHFHDDGCDALAWTHRRYATDVVASMIAALRAYLATRSFDDMVLIGYSGGGTLAWLMARELPATRGVVTIAANLQVNEWAQLHDYTPLEGSLDPAALSPLSPQVVQLHYVGGRDRNVPPRIARAFVERHGGRVDEIAEFDHVCCWVRRWPALLHAAGLPADTAREGTRP